MIGPMTAKQAAEIQRYRDALEQIARYKRLQFLKRKQQRAQQETKRWF